jgi:hypothetical protein
VVLIAFIKLNLRIRAASVLKIPLDTNTRRRFIKSVALFKSLKEENPRLLALAIIYPIKRYILIKYLNREALKS